MKNIILALIHIVVLTQSFAQSPKLKKVKESGMNGPYVYCVLKNNPEVKHGEYVQKPWGGPELLITGQYDMGKKTGLWIERYYMKGFHGLKSKGGYNNDVKVGEWIYFDLNKDTVQDYDYDNNQMVYSKACSNLRNSNRKNQNTLLDCDPEYIGGITKLIFELREAVIKNSKEHQTRDVKVDIEIQLTINEEGELIKTEYSYPIKESYKKRIEECLNKSDKLWKPGESQGEYVTAMFVFPLQLHFKY